MKGAEREEKTEIVRKSKTLIERIRSQHDLRSPRKPIPDSKSGINERKGAHFCAFSPLPYMAGQRQLVPVFNRLAAAALLRGSALTLLMLNYFWSKAEKRRVLGARSVRVPCHLNRTFPFCLYAR